MGAERRLTIDLALLDKMPAQPSNHQLLEIVSRHSPHGRSAWLAIAGHIIAVALGLFDCVTRGHLSAVAVAMLPHLWGKRPSIAARLLASGKRQATFVDYRPRLHHQGNALGVADIGDGIRIKQHKVGKLPRSDRSHPVSHAKEHRSIQSRNANNLKV